MNSAAWPLARHALALALAAWLSFAVAASFHVHNAYWAAMPVWVLTQPSRGLVLERAIFRVIGTLFGAAVGFALVHLPVPPVVQLLLLACWIALNAGLTHVLRGVTGYAALLAGMTAAIVLLPSVLSPDESMAIAVARVECTLIGVIVSTLVLAVFTPATPLAEFYAEVRALAAEAVAYARRVVGDELLADPTSEERRLLGRISQLDSRARLMTAGSVEGYRRIGDVDHLLVGALTTMAAAQALRGESGGASSALRERLERIADHLRGSPLQPMGETERRLQEDGNPAVARLQAAIGQVLDADFALHHPRPRPMLGAEPRPARLAPHREWALAGRTGALAGGVTFLAAVLGLWSGWAPMSLAAVGVCIFVMVLGSLPLPQLVAPKLLTGVIVGVVIAVVYRLAVQPTVTGTGSLLLTLAPFFLLGGVARADSRTGAAGIDANMCFLIASQAGMPAVTNPLTVVSDAGALGMAATLVAGAFILLPRRSARQAADAADLLRRDLQRIIESGTHHDAADWHARGGRQILRLTLHLGRAPELGERWPGGLLAVLNLGQAMIDAQEAGMPQEVRRLLTALVRNESSAVEVARSLQVMAEASTDAALRRALARLAHTLPSAAPLLSFGMTGRPPVPAANGT